MQRRSLILGVAAGGLAGVAGGVWWWRGPGVSATVDAAGLRAVLAQLRAQRWEAMQGWPPAQVFNHCAQSIEYSLAGYPQLKPAWFRASAGPAALALFQARGAMQHALNEAIPGAAPLAEPAAADAALDRLEVAFERFLHHTGPLAEHFAYGTLDHRQYTAAHILHVYNHLQWLRPAQG